MANDKKFDILEVIAKEELFVETLETRSSDSLDFYDTSVWQMKAALVRAYEAGRQSTPENQKLFKAIYGEGHNG